MAVEQKVDNKKKPAASEKKSVNFFSGIVKFFKELKGEAKRITWASKEQVKKSVVIVLTYCVICTALVALLDFGFNNLYKVIFKLS